MPMMQFPVRSSASARTRLGSVAFCAVLALVLQFSAKAQQSAPDTSQPAAAPVSSPTPPGNQTSAPAAAAQNPPATDSAPPYSTDKPQPATGQALAALPGEITETDLKQLLVGKPLYLRGGYLDSSLTFNEHGALIGHSPQGSYTLNGITIDKVRLTKHKVELEGTRYGLHFLGALPYEDPANAVDRVRITPKKKMVKITIDREQVLKPKKEKESRKGKDHEAKSGVPERAAPTSATGQTLADTSQPSEADQVKAEIAAAPKDERPADPDSVTSTYSPAHAAGVLKGALDRIFASGIDDRLIASMPDCWKLYYQAVAANADYRPIDPAVLRQNAVDTKAKLLTTFQPVSNEYAQASAVAGLALYHTVVGPDGKPTQIAVGRPIGFGLDENAVAAIRKAAFEPAIKDGKPVAVLLDLVVEFHIYSKRTAAADNPLNLSKPAGPSLPGPYSLLHQ